MLSNVNMLNVFYINSFGMFNEINEIFCAIVCDSISFVTLRSTFKNFMTETSFVSKYFNFFRSFFFKYTFLFPGIKYYQRHIILSD